MRAGRLRHRIVLQARSGAVNALNELLDTWVDWKAVPAAIEPLSGREFLAAQQVQSDISHRLTIRYLAGVTPKHRAVWTDPATDVARIFDIRAVLDRDERHREMQLMCTERG